MVLQGVPDCGLDLISRAGDNVGVVVDQALGKERLGFIGGAGGVLGIRARNLRVV
jgi:hypothetical protein